MKSIRRNVLICLLSAPLAQGVVYAADSNKPMDQVVVEGTRADLVKLGKEVVQAEERFYQRYNEINTRKKYAVNCYEEAETGTRFKKKYCKPVYENEADAAEGREFMLAMGRGASPGSATSGSVASSGVMYVGASAGTTANPGFSVGAMDAAPFGQGTQAGGTVASFIDIANGRPEFQKNVVEVANKSPELMKLLKEHAALVERYQALYRKVNESEAAQNPEGAAPPAE